MFLLGNCLKQLINGQLSFLLIDYCSCKHSEYVCECQPLKLICLLHLLPPVMSPHSTVITDGFVDFDAKFDWTRLLVKIPQVSFLNHTLVPISQILNLGENTKSHKQSQKVFSISALSSLFCSQFLFFNCLIGIFLVEPLRLYIHLRTYT